MSYSKLVLLIALACSILQVAITEYNIAKVGAETLIKTADSPSYINPAINFIEKGEWKDNFDGPSSYVQRAPFYGVLFLFSLTLSSHPLIVLKVIQYICMLGGIFFFGKTIHLLTRNRVISLIAVTCFGMLPFFHGFVGYVMTEAIAPYIVITFIYSFVRLYNDQKGQFLFITLGAIILIFRIQLIIFPLLFIITLLIKHKQKALWTFLMFVPLLFWQLRVNHVMGSFQLHPIYSYSNKTIFRPPHQELTNLLRVWEHDSEQFHKAEAILRKDTTQSTLNQATNLLTNESRSSARNILALYQQVAIKQNEMWEKGENRKLPIEELFVAEARKFEKLHRNDFSKYNYWLYTPSNSFWDLFKSSHLNHYIFQKTFRGSLFIEVLRFVAILIITSSLISSMLLLLSKKISTPFKVVILAFTLSLLYLVFIQRMNETRYMTPYLPILFTGLWLFYSNFKNQLSA